jgi:hypothetical protein
VLAALRLRDANLHLGAERRLLEGDLEVVPEVGTARSATAPGPGGAEDVAEDLPEDVVQVRGVEAAESLERAAHVPEAVIPRTFFRVRQHLVGLRGLLEALLCLVVAGVPIGVVLQRKLPVGALQVRRRALPSHTEDLVVVALRCRGRHPSCSTLRNERRRRGA